MKTLKNLLLDQLVEMYAGEQEIARVLSRLINLAANEELKEALKNHAYETVGHISKVAEIFASFGEPTQGAKGNALALLLADADFLIQRHQGSPVSDAMIIAVTQKLEHYEIATYSFLRDWAKMLHNGEAAVLFEEILTEENACDAELSRLANADIEAVGRTKWSSEDASEEIETLGRRGHKQGLRHQNWRQYIWRPHGAA